MTARLAEAWAQTGLIPRGSRHTRLWHSGEVNGVRVLATQRSHSLEVQALASRIFGSPAFPSYRGAEGTVYGRLSTLTEDTGGWRVIRAEHGTACLACIQYVVPAISTAAATGSTGSTYGVDRMVKRWYEMEPGEEPERIQHNVTVTRVEASR